MHRTQIYLEENHYQILRSQARREGKSLAAIIREILQTHLAGRHKATAQDPFRRVIGIGKGDGSRVAENCEEYLYGEER
jgi:predicted DNA-binding ribbon-helix-helix protein